MTILYKAIEVMEKLEIKDSAFKKYISILEKEGYIIVKINKVIDCLRMKI